MNPGEPEDWEAWKGFHWAAMEGRIPNPPTISWREIMNERNDALGIFGVASGPVLLDAIEDLPPGDSARSLEVRFGLLASWVLARHGLEITPNSRLLLLRKVAEAALDAGWAMKRASLGDYTPDPKANRFPPIEAKSGRENVTLTNLFDRWQAETKPAASTLSTWRGVVRSLREHLKHDDAGRITADDVIGWKDSLVAAGRSGKTINDGHLAALRALLTFGVSNRLLPTNVAVGVRVAAKRKAGEGRLPYTDAEVGRLLGLARGEGAAHLRWLPWLAALTGARIGELAQLWGSRVIIIDGIHVLELRPAEDGGSFKNEGSERTVPLHPAIIAEGFLDFVKVRGKGPLFYGRSSGDPTRKHASKGVSNRVGEWVRASGFTDPRKDPNHALRHWFKSAASRAGVQDSVVDAIQGHAGKSDADDYRHFGPPELFRAVASIPVPTIPADAERSLNSRGGAV